MWVFLKDFFNYLVSLFYLVILVVFEIFIIHFKSYRVVLRSKDYQAGGMIAKSGAARGQKGAREYHDRKSKERTRVE